MQEADGADTKVVRKMGIQILKGVGEGLWRARGKRSMDEHRHCTVGSACWFGWAAHGTAHGRKHTRLHVHTLAVRSSLKKKETWGGGEGLW